MRTRIPDVPLEERFWSRVDRRGDDQCWPWTGAVSNGYGFFWLRIGELGLEQGRFQTAHRVAFRLTHDHWPMPLGLHGCDNRLCCNPLNPDLELHVHEGTTAKNAQERAQRGRSAVNRHRAKLTYEQAAEIRERWIRGQKPSQADLAREYGVSQMAISFIVQGKTYRGCL
jgi:hypothetical protein